MSFVHHPLSQRVGKTLGHWGKRVFVRLLDAVLPTLPNVPIDAVCDVRRVLLVRPNFRIGNTLISTPLIVALRERFPGASLDYLSGDTTSALLAHLPVDTVHLVSRRFVTRPWRFVALFTRLRRLHYDVAVEAGMGSFSGALYTYLTGARYRVGCGGKTDRFLNVRLPAVHVAHKYEEPVAFARLLGVSCPDHPVYEIGPAERSAALTLLRRWELATESVARPFIALFVGGHLEKRWPAAQWIELARSLVASGARVVMFLGPEEAQSESRYRRELPPGVRVLGPQPLRLFAALWSAARLIVTPDSGPMHLAAAVGVPVIAVLRGEISGAYAPRGPQDRSLAWPTVAAVVAAVVSHPVWPDIISSVS
jgi:lipopolysaccharide heptosyltransferase III